MAHKKKNVRKKECPVCEREFSWTKKLDKYLGDQRELYHWYKQSFVRR